MDSNTIDRTASYVYARSSINYRTGGYGRESMHVAPYDAIAEDYVRLHQQQPPQKYAVYPSFYRVVGDVNGQIVADFASGAGIVARELADRGAAHVVAVDLSEKMLDIAKDQHPEGKSIEYRQGKVGCLGPVDRQYDKITGAYLLHYGETVFELCCMCFDIADRLRPGGMFIAINTDPEKVKLLHKRALHEGQPLRWKIKVGDESVYFTNYHWSRQTYEAALNKAGLTAEWLDVEPTAMGRKLYGHAYWEAAKRKALPISILRCVKR